MSEEQLNEEIAEDRKPKASRWDFPRLDHPLNLRLNVLRGGNVARVYFVDGIVSGYECVRDVTMSVRLEDDEVQEILARLAEEFRWDVAGEKVLQLRTMRFTAGKKPVEDQVEDLADADLQG